MKTEWTVEEAAAAMAADELVYIDIRSRAEVETGLPAGAWHIPLYDSATTGAMEVNQGFVAEVAALLAASAPRRCAVACAHGVRSRQAVEILRLSGIEIDEVPGGWDGLRDGWGQVLAAGWSHLPLPTEPTPAAARSHAAVLGLLAG
ncbi:MAG: hypothetical protein RIT45_847 [Pseudomonadota bacterium]|jgi:rhodanese-related sulfurtransferase